MPDAPENSTGTTTPVRIVINEYGNGSIGLAIQLRQSTIEIYFGTLQDTIAFGQSVSQLAARMIAENVEAES